MTRSGLILHAVCGAGVGAAIAIVLLFGGLAGGGSDRWLRLWAALTLPGITISCATSAAVAPLLVSANGKNQTMVAADPAATARNTD